MGRDAVTAAASRELADVWRLAVALTPDESAARRAVADVVCRADAASDAWADDDDARRWFRLHAVQTLRRFPPAAADRDPLAGDVDVEIRAALVALRHLPRQQQEAVVLTHGLGLGERALGMAMDCSTTAARTHLAGAHASLAALGDARTLSGGIGEAVRSVAVPASFAVTIRRRRHARRWLTTARQALLWAAVASVAGVIAAVAWLVATRVEV